MAIRNGESGVALWDIADDVTLYLITYDGRLEILQSYRAALALALANRMLRNIESRLWKPKHLVNQSYRKGADELRDRARVHEKFFIKIKYDLLPEGHGWKYMSTWPGYGVEALENSAWRRGQNREMCMLIDREGVDRTILWKHPYHKDKAWVKPVESGAHRLPFTTAICGYN
jgi:hypothetical protein